ncbi:MAG TPA: hypothetical protein VEX86_16345 [Longimicrobium sp.]|nr:hypothetical protein [Longimicrobium sp.]
MSEKIQGEATAEAAELNDASLEQVAGGCPGDTTIQPVDIFPPDMWILDEALEA